jgi:hypothetical protein
MARVWWLGYVIRPHASGLIICAHPRLGQEFTGLGNPHLLSSYEQNGFHTCVPDATSSLVTSS